MKTPSLQSAIPPIQAGTAGDDMVEAVNDRLRRIQLTQGSQQQTTTTVVRSTGTSGVPLTRQIATTAPLQGGGDLSADRTLTIDAFTGDSGSGGLKGAVPAPAAGDAAAGKYLKANGSWAVPPGTGSGGPTTQSVVTGSRAYATVYHNTGSTPLYVTVTASRSFAGGTITAYVDSSSTPTTGVAAQSANAGWAAALFFIVLPGYYYKVTDDTSSTIGYWVEWS